MASSKFTWNQATLSRVERNVQLGMLKLAYKIGSEAQRGAPVLTGAMVNSMRVTDDHNGQLYILIGGRFAGKNIPYAKRQEYENKRHPYFMKNAFAWGTEHWPEYFKGVTK